MTKSRERIDIGSPEKGARMVRMPRRISMLWARHAEKKVYPGTQYFAKYWCLGSQEYYDDNKLAADGVGVEAAKMRKVPAVCRKQLLHESW